MRPKKQILKITSFVIAILFSATTVAWCAPETCLRPLALDEASRNNSDTAEDGASDPMGLKHRPRRDLYKTSAAHFDYETGLAKTLKGRLLAMQMYQDALNRFIELLSQIREVDGVPVTIEAVALGGSLIMGKARFGVYRPDVSFKSVQKASGRLQKTFDPLRMPSDIDVRLRYRTEDPIRRKQITAAVEVCRRQVFDEFGIYVDARVFFFTNLLAGINYLDIERYKGDGLKRFFANALLGGEDIMEDLGIFHFYEPIPLSTLSEKVINVQQSQI